MVVWYQKCEGDFSEKLRLYGKYYNIKGILLRLTLRKFNGDWDEELYRIPLHLQAEWTALLPDSL